MELKEKDYDESTLESLHRMCSSSNNSFKQLYIQQSIQDSPSTQ
jgi:hypothetical protein